jgi:NADH-quinone oxidoreductase subunit C
VTHDALNEKYAARFPAALRILPVFRGEVTWVVELPQVREVLRTLRDEDGFDYLVDLSTVDNLGGTPRFEVVYELFGYGHRRHLRVKAHFDEHQNVPTVSGIWRTAEWHEREAYDMMGITFEGHPDPRRILMWEGYPHFPLRKDFPLEGKPTEMPDIAFTRPAPLEGGPFVTSSGDRRPQEREPRAKHSGEAP